VTKDPLQTGHASHDILGGLSRRSLAYVKSIGKTSRRHRFDTSEMRFKVRSSLSVIVRHGSWRSLLAEGGGESRNIRMISWSSSGKLSRVAMLSVIGISVRVVSGVWEADASVGTTRLVSSVGQAHC
jgi:hypothetical protein